MLLLLFRKVVFAILIMLIVLFYSQGIMGDKEFSWEGFFAWWKSRPEAIRNWPEKRRAKRAARKEARASKSAAKDRAKQAKQDSEKRKQAGEALFTPLPLADHVVVFEKEGK